MEKTTLNICEGKSYLQHMTSAGINSGSKKCEMAEQMQAVLSHGLEGNLKSFNDEGFLLGRNKKSCGRDEVVNLLSKNITFINAEGLSGQYPQSTDSSSASSVSEPSDDSPEWTLPEKVSRSASEDETGTCNSDHFQSKSASLIKDILTTQQDGVHISSSSHQEPTSDEHSTKGTGSVGLKMEAIELKTLKEQTTPIVFPAIKKQGVQGDTVDRPYKCTHCSWAFKKLSNLLSHIDTHRGLKPHVCELCGKAYSHQGTLQQHKRLHTGERPYLCPFCNRTYIWSSDYRKHIRTHTGEKPYACGTCGKDFVRSSDLRKHERNIHTNDKPYPCPQCGKTFNKPLSLLRHQRTHLGEKPFSCPDCGKAFAVASRMVEHQKTHQGVRPYTCSVCLKAFTKSSNLLEHQTLHSGLRPHKCPECGMAFAMASRLVRHRRVHAVKQPLGCSRCGRAFSRSGMLKRHQERCRGQGQGASPLRSAEPREPPVSSGSHAV
ncbi:zinc finger protein 648 [Anguilla anguilla]|uniref:zinc finger protein 648 n=1 Tax=Anguilla anguilla TaxID=7936 RepID=UPI0015AB57F6|nr:zinc finger protein 648 [Anguilla anguilla]